MTERLADRLFLARDPRNPALAPGSFAAPAGIEAAYAEQAALVRRLGDAGGGRPVGWKIGATSKAAQRFLDVAEPFAGQVLKQRLLRSPARLKADAFRFRLIEPEYAFTLARGLPPRARDYSPAEVAAAVGQLHPALEIVSSAYGPEGWRAVGGRALIADNGAHGALVLGEGRRDWQGLDIGGGRVELRIDGRLFGTGSGTAALGHPLKALAWLASFLGRRGRGLAAGEVVTTGVVTPFTLLEAGQRASADFQDLGSCRVDFDTV